MNFFDKPLPGWPTPEKMHAALELQMAKPRAPRLAPRQRQMLITACTLLGVSFFLLREQLFLFGNIFLSNPSVVSLSLAGLILLWPELKGMYRSWHLSHIPLNILERNHPYLPSSRQILLALSCFLVNGALTATSIALEASSETYTELRVWQIANDAVGDDETIENGMLADDVIGQTDGTFASLTKNFTRSRNLSGAPNKFGMMDPHDTTIDRVNHRLFVTDRYGFRILVYDLNSSNQLVDYVPDYVLGQPDFNTRTTGTTASKVNSVFGMTMDQDRSYLFVADYGNNRVLVFDVANITTGEDAIYVLGQQDFTSSATTPLNSSSMNNPTTLAYDHTNDRLFVGDFVNRRILVFSGASLSNGMSATNLLGQPTYTADAAITPNNKYISSVWGLSYDETGQRLFASIINRNRVVVFSFTGGIVNYMAASWVLGQPDFNTFTARTTQRGFNLPVSSDYDPTNKRFFVADPLNRRVMIFDLSNGIQTYMSGSYVLGQSSFTTTLTGTTASMFQYVNSAKYDRDNNLLYVTDSYSNRVLQFDVATISNGEDAIDVLGQSNGTYNGSTFTKSFTSNYQFDGLGYIGLSQPGGTAIDAVNHRLYIADTSNNRVLVHTLNSDNTLADRFPDYVLGQPGFHDRFSAGTTAALMSGPRAVAIDEANNRLYVADTGNNRVMVFDTTTIVNKEDATYILGQGGTTSSAAATSITGLRTPTGLAYDESTSRLFIADSGNNRVIVHNTTSLSTGKSANAVLGQTSYTASTARTTQKGLRSPTDVAINTGSQLLYVADSSNNRVLVYGFTGSVSNNMSGTLVLGQTSFTSSGASTTSTTMRSPRGVSYDAPNNRLYVSDTLNNRILMFASGSVVTGGTGSYVFGQTSFTSSGANTTQRIMSGALMAMADPDNNLLYVSDTGNNRILVYNFIEDPEEDTDTTADTTSGVRDSGGGSRRDYVPVPIEPGSRRTTPGATQPGQIAPPLRPAASSSSSSRSKPRTARERMLLRRQERIKRRNLPLRLLLTPPPAGRRGW